MEELINERYFSIIVLFPHQVPLYGKELDYWEKT